MKKKGFTLIELMAVIAIMGILSVILYIATEPARAKARDSRRIQDMEQLSKALALYDSTSGTPPPNENDYSFGTMLHTLQTAPPYQGFAACDNPVPDAPGGQDTMLFPTAYNAELQLLVNAKDLSQVPHGIGAYGYCYYNDVADKQTIVFTQLETYPPSATGIAPGCRPLSTNSACGPNKDREYCICSPY